MIHPEPGFSAPPEPITLSDNVSIEFYEGAAPGVWWASMHMGRDVTEIGSVHSPADIRTVLTMAAGRLLERPHWADDTHVSEGGRWVLIGEWVLSAMLSDPTHVHYGTEQIARDVFDRRANA